MHFDDRLGTVLRLNATGEAVQRIQLRQLLDLLGTSPVEARGDQLDAAFVRISELSARIPTAERAAMIRDAGLRLRSPRLVAALAESDPTVAAAALQRAKLEPEQWLDLIPALPPSARQALRDRRDLPVEVNGLLGRLGVNDRGLPPVGSSERASQTAAPSEIAADIGKVAQTAAAEVAQPTQTGQVNSPTQTEPAQAEDVPADTTPTAAILPAQPISGDSGIGAIVRRIESYRRARQVVDQAPQSDAPRLPLGEEHVLIVPDEIRAFDFAADAEGKIVWSDPGSAPMVNGLILGNSICSQEFNTLVRRYQPLRRQALRLDGAPAISGEWQLDAAPWFDPLTGRFLGYRGRMRRPLDAHDTVPVVRDSEADRIRQVLHELRTPVNAIQVGAEIIQQQLFGPSPHEYRAVAATIAGDAARMLSAFEELERLAKLDSAALELERGETDLAAVVAATVKQLGNHTSQRGSGFVFKDEAPALKVGLAGTEVERIVWRLLATLAGVSATGELLRLRLRERGGMARIDVALPGSLAGRTDEDLFKAAAGAIPQIISAGVFGVGFALRLARAEARAAGGELVRKNDRIRLTLPGLTAEPSVHTERQRIAAGTAPN
ncbi:MAG: HAMP domain-containing histidine kinase [Sphingomonadales bacterium]|nr:HAMP domain-containing histidine kinase [Sphingomonadales bacterium]